VTSRAQSDEDGPVILGPKPVILSPKGEESFLRLARFPHSDQILNEAPIVAKTLSLCRGALNLPPSGRRDA